MKTTITLEQAIAATASQRSAIGSALQAETKAIASSDAAYVDLYNAIAVLEKGEREAGALFWAVVITESTDAKGNSTLTNRRVCDIAVALGFDYSLFLKDVKGGHALTGYDYKSTMFARYKSLFEEEGLITKERKSTKKQGAPSRPMKKALTAAQTYLKALEASGFAPRSEEVVSVKAHILAFGRAAKQEEEALKAEAAKKKAAAKK